MKTRILATVAFAVMLVTVFGTAAFADPVLSLRYRIDSGAWITIDDNGGLDQTSTLGVVSYANFDGIWDFSVATGQGSPPLPNLNLDLNSDVTIDGGGTGTLEIELSQINLTPSASGWDLNWGPLGALPATLKLFAGSNTLFDDSGTPLEVMLSSGGSQHVNGPASLTSPYSLTLDLTVTASNAADGDSSSGNARAALTPVPEPNTLLLLGAGLLLTAGFGIRSNRTNRSQN